MSSNQPINFNDVINQALKDNPHLQNSPGLASDAIKSGNPTVAGPMLVHGATVNGTVQAAQDYAAANAQPQHWWDGIVHAATTGLEVLVKPLQEVQRDYKYIHSLYARHGFLWGTLGTLAVAAGATIGTFTGGPAGTVLGADLAGTALRKLGGQMDEFKTSYADSENPNYKVSMGRDVANLLGAHGQTDNGWGKWVSGSVDAGFDLGLDPLMKLGALSKGVKAGEFIAGGEKTVPWLYRSQGVQDFLLRNSVKLTGDSAQLDAVFRAGMNPTAGDKLMGTGRQYLKALSSMTDKTSGEIAFAYPKLQGFASDLAKAGSTGATEAEKVENLHKAMITSMTVAEEMGKAAIGGIAEVPSRTVLRAITSKTANKLRQWDTEAADAGRYNYNNAANFILPRKVGTATGDTRYILPLAVRPLSREAWQTAIAQKTRTFSGYQPFSIDPKTLELSTKVFNPMAPDAGLNVYKIARFSMGHKAAQDIASNYMDAINAGDLAEAKRVYGNGIHSMFKAAGFPDDPKAISDLLDQIHVKVGDTTDGIYGHGLHLKHLVNEVTTEDATKSTALSTDQIGSWAMPDFREFKLAVRSMSNAGKLYGRVDEFIARNWTDSIFKPFALLTAGFGMRVAASELIPTMIRFGGVKTIAGKLAVGAESRYYDLAKVAVKNQADKLGYKLAKGEEDHILSHVALQLSGNGTDYTALHYGASAGALEKADKLTADLTAEAKDAGAYNTFLRKQAEKVEGKRVKKTKAAVMSKIASEGDLDLAARIAIATQGHMGTGAVLSGHGTSLDFTEKQKEMFHILGQKMHTAMTEDPTGKFAMYGKESDHFPIYWTTAVQKMSQNSVYQNIARDVLDVIKKKGYAGKDERILTEATPLEEARIKGVDLSGAPLVNDTYAAERKLITRYRTQDSNEFAMHRVDNLLNHVTGADGTIHEDLLRQIAAGIKPNLERIAGTASEARPVEVFGQALIPYIGPNLKNRIVQEGFKKVVDPIVAHMSREPLFFQHVKQAMEFYQPAIDKGLIDEYAGLRLAMTRATHAMIPQIHNVALRSQFSILARNYLPFYFAQEQAMKRYIQLGKDAPEALRTYQLIDQGMNNPGFIETDAQGNKFVTVPGVGELGSGIISAAASLGMPVVGGLPLTVKGDTQSLATVLPEVKMPGTSPMLSIGLNTLNSFFPQLSRPIKTVVGSRGFNQSVIDSLIPSSPVRSWFKALTANEQESTFHSAMLSAMAAASYHNQLPAADASPSEKQAFIDRIKNNARSILVIKGLLGVVSPLSPRVSQEDPGLSDEFYKLVQKTNDYPKALQMFLDKHGTGAISYTVARSEATVKGANMPYTDEVANWLQSNQALVTGPNAVGASFLIPQAPGAAGDRQAIYDEVLKMHLRKAKTPEDFRDSIYISTGNNQYFPAKQAHDEAVLAFTKQGNTDAVAAENAHWKQYTDGMKLANPIWADDFQSATKRDTANRALSDLTTLFSVPPSKGGAPDNEQSKLVKTLLSDYNNHTQARNTIKAFNNGMTLTDEDANWQDYLTNLAKTEPRLSTIINGVFRRLP